MHCVTRCAGPRRRQLDQSNRCYDNVGRCPAADWQSRVRLTGACRSGSPTRPNCAGGVLSPIAGMSERAAEHGNLFQSAACEHGTIRLGQRLQCSSRRCVSGDMRTGKKSYCCTAPLWLGRTKAFDAALQQAMLAAMGYLPEALPAGVAGPGPGKRKGAPLSTAAQVPGCRGSDLIMSLEATQTPRTSRPGGSCCTWRTCTTAIRPLVGRACWLRSVMRRWELMCCHERRSGCGRGWRRCPRGRRS